MKTPEHRRSVFRFARIRCLVAGYIFTGLASTTLWAQGTTSVQSTSPDSSVVASGGVDAPGPPGISKAAADAENPIAQSISIPFQNNTFFDVGRYEHVSNTLLIEPVVPFRLGDQWSLITRTIVPVIYEPRTGPDQGAVTGLGNIEPQFYFSPTHPGKLIWGVGPQFWIPTATNRELGLNKWGGGPTAVALVIDGPWLVGSLVNNVWAGSGRSRVDQMTINPFFNYNFAHGWYVDYAPVIVANWTVGRDNRWTVPVGAGIGRVFRIDRQGVNARVQVLKDVIRPAYAPSWQLQVQVQFLFPEK